MHVIITNKMKNKKYYIFGTILNPIEKSQKKTENRRR
jgi:hypothetical protein